MGLAAEKIEEETEEKTKEEVEEDYCEEHDEPFKNGRCVCCERLKETGFPYECSDHGLHDGPCLDCAQDESRFEQQR